MINETLILVLVCACLIVNLFTLFVVFFMNKTKSRSIISEQLSTVHIAPANEKVFSSVQGIVFCRSCGNQYDSILSECPKCKTAR